MINKIIDKANELGITEIGFVNSKAFEEKEIFSSSAMAKTLSMTNVSEIMADAKTVIVYLTPYKTAEEPKNLSCYAIGEDYHKVCGAISEEIASVLRKNGYKSIHLTDNNPLCERELARMAGLGIIGKNGFLINEKYGSYTFISCIVTDCKIEPSAEKKDSCLGCGNCIDACPGKALTETGFDENKCVSFITQKKGELNDFEKELIKKSGSVWGCDICQKVCPMNKNAEYTEIQKFANNLILCIENEDLSNREFRKKYSSRAFAWRGKAVIDRNLSIFNENN